MRLPDQTYVYQSVKEGIAYARGSGFHVEEVGTTNPTAFRPDVKGEFRLLEQPGKTLSYIWHRNDKDIDVK